MILIQLTDPGGRSTWSHTGSGGPAQVQSEHEAPELRALHLGSLSRTYSPSPRLQAAGIPCLAETFLGKEIELV